MSVGRDMPAARYAPAGREKNSYHIAFGKTEYIARERSERISHLRSKYIARRKPYIATKLLKPGCIVNKTFVEMLDKLGYDIQITYVKKEPN